MSSQLSALESSTQNTSTAFEQSLASLVPIDPSLPINPSQMVGIMQVGPNGEESEPQLIPMSALNTFLASNLTYRRDEEEDEDEEKNDEETVVSDIKDADNYFEAPKKSPTREMTSDQLLDGICKFVSNIMERDPNVEYSGFGPNVRYIEENSNIKLVIISNIIFEVNQITVSSIRIVRNTSTTPPVYTVTIFYITQVDHYRHGPKYSFCASNSDLRVAVDSVYTNLKKMQRCHTCKTVYDTSVTDHCVVCLFSDYFTKENPLITCVVCTEKVRDFTTVSCGHRFCYPCIQQVTNRKCPLCRTIFKL